MICITVVSVLLLSSLIALAIYYKSIKSAENNFIPAEITNAVQENINGSTEEWDDNQEPTPESKELTWTDNSDGSYSAVKQVKILNVDNDNENNTDAYIRVCIIPRWINTVSVGDNSTDTDITGVSELGDFGNLTDIEINNNTYSMGKVTFTLNEAWEDYWIYNKKDGYFYYKKSVAPGDTTEILLESISIDKDVYANISSDGDYSSVSLRVDVISDSIQTGGEAVETRWKNSGIAINADGTLVLEEQDQTD